MSLKSRVEVNSKGEGSFCNGRHGRAEWLYVLYLCTVLERSLLRPRYSYWNYESNLTAAPRFSRSGTLTPYLLRFSIVRLRQIAFGIPQ